MKRKKERRKNIEDIKKRENKNIKIYDKKREKKRENEDSPLLKLSYHKGPWSIHTICIWPSLVARLRWTIEKQATNVAASKLPSTNAIGKYS
jgi:hypothetical protein